MRYKLKEHPDGTVGNKLSWKDLDARAFGYFDKKMYVAVENSTFHSELVTGRISQRNDFMYPGRLWIDHKIISFWKYPKDFNTLKKISKDIKKEIDVDILSNGWLIEIVTNDDNVANGKSLASPFMKDYESELIPTTEYKQSKERSKDELEIQHNLSPLKKSKKQVPKGVGSSKGYQTREFQKKYTSENLIRKIVKEEIKRFKNRK